MCFCMAMFSHCQNVSKHRALLQISQFSRHSFSDFFFFFFLHSERKEAILWCYSNKTLKFTEISVFQWTVTRGHCALSCGSTAAHRSLIKPNEIVLGCKAQWKHLNYGMHKFHEIKAKSPSLKTMVKSGVKISTTVPITCSTTLL